MAAVRLSCVLSLQGKLARNYWHLGAVGDFRVRESMELSHEIAGTIVALGAEVTGLEPGTPVAIHPETVCGECPECWANRPNLCHNVRYLGSAARFQHVQGGFRQRPIVPARQVSPLLADLAPERAVVAEPLAVARAIDADATLRADQESASWPDDFDVAVEASGAPAALNTCMRRVARGGSRSSATCSSPKASTCTERFVSTRCSTMRCSSSPPDSTLRLLSTPPCRWTSPWRRRARSGPPPLFQGTARTRCRSPELRTRSVYEQPEHVLRTDYSRR